MTRMEKKALGAGAVITLVAHAIIVWILISASTANPQGSALSDATQIPHRRPAHGFLPMRGRRNTDGPLPRANSLEANAFPRRSPFALAMRRGRDEGQSRNYRGLELNHGRRWAEAPRRLKPRTIDWGGNAPEVLEAMLIPKLGLKAASKNEMPRLTKYEQPKKEEAGVNISNDNPQGKPLQFQELFEKEAQLDKRKKKKKSSLDEIIDAPDDDDPRKRASALDEIVGVADGSTKGEGVVGKAGNAYLGTVTLKVQETFKVPVFLTADELAALSLEVVLMKMDAQGHVLGYKIMRASPNNAFNTAALSAVKRFMPAEGGDLTLPPPSPQMLELINKHGLLVRLDGKKR